MATPETFGKKKIVELISIASADLFGPFWTFCTSADLLRTVTLCGSFRTKTNIETYMLIIRCVHCSSIEYYKITNVVATVIIIKTSYKSQFLKDSLNKLYILL